MGIKAWLKYSPSMDGNRVIGVLAKNEALILKTRSKFFTFDTSIVTVKFRDLESMNDALFEMNRFSYNEVSVVKIKIYE